VAEVSNKIYRVSVTREDSAWLADVPNLQGVHTWARNLPTLDRSVREAIALAEDLPDGAEASLRLDYKYNIGNSELNRLTAQLRAERGRIQRAERELAKATAAAASRLRRDADLSVRDAAALLAVSPQRVSQIAPQPAKAAPKVTASTTKKAAKKVAKKAGPVRRERRSA
jgi:hypothetical protein